MPGKIPSLLTEGIPAYLMQKNTVGDSKNIPLTEPVFVNVYGAQESIPRNRFRQPLYTGGPVRQIGFRTGPPGWESISGLLKISTNTGSA
jgi:hypothetical protein